jgi:hypothetical protein
MLDQSFSSDNFRLILDSENRKGIYLEGRYFPEVEKVTNKIRDIYAEIKMKRRELIDAAFDEYYKAVSQRLEDLKGEKENLLRVELQKVSEKILDTKFSIKLNKNTRMYKKPVYTVEDKPEYCFALKQIQSNFRKLYKVKQSNRYAIVSQVKTLLNNSFPKYVIRTDIEDFYENIPHNKLVEKLNEDNLLTYISRKIISQILKCYRDLSGSDKGLPRGIGISAYLAELYMRDIDNSIKDLNGVSYYSRYVDDIIVVVTPRAINENKKYLESIEQIIIKHGLAINRAKTFEFDLFESNTPRRLEYLGYKYSFGNGSVDLSLSKSKLDKYKKRIDLTISAYVNFSKINEKKARKILVKRVKYLTGNTRLLNNKRNILIGIYHTNSLLSNTADLLALDRYLEARINVLIKCDALRVRLNGQKFSFQNGFNQKTFWPFTTQEFTEITDAWKYENSL